jgi:hypothetical protein
MVGIVGILIVVVDMIINMIFRIIAEISRVGLRDVEMIQFIFIIGSFNFAGIIYSFYGLEV